MRRLEDAVDGVEVSRAEFFHHLFDELGPFVWEVVLANDGNRVRQLLLNGRLRAEHQVDDVILDGESVLGMDFVGFVVFLEILTKIDVYL